MSYNWKAALVFSIVVIFIYGFWSNQSRTKHLDTLEAIALEQEPYKESGYSATDELNNFREASDARNGIAVVVLLIIWLPLLVRRDGKTKNKNSLVLALPILLLAACKPYNKPDIVEIGPNETAFVVPLGSDTTGQLQFQSVEFLASNQVATKRVIIPKEEFQTGRMYWQIEYIPSVRVIVVDRTPVTREWTSSGETGTSSSNQSFGVESSESIDFRVGATCSARVDEEDAAAFLYYFSGKSLAQVMDENVRGYIQAELFREFGSLSLEDARLQKGDIFLRVFEAARDHFAPLGVTITSLGGSDGLIYNDANVQAVINRNFEAQQQRVQQEAAATAQAVENQRLLSQANAQATATVVAGQAAADVQRIQGEANADVIRSEGQAQADVLAIQGAQLGLYPSIVDYEIARRSQGNVPQFLFLGGGTGTGELPFSFFLDPNTMATPQPSIIPTPTPTNP